jgi:hypothetical protein
MQRPYYPRLHSQHSIIYLNVLEIKIFQTTHLIPTYLVDSKNIVSKNYTTMADYDKSLRLFVTVNNQPATTHKVRRVFCLTTVFQG